MSEATTSVPRDDSRGLSQEEQTALENVGRTLVHLLYQALSEVAKSPTATPRLRGALTKIESLARSVAERHGALQLHAVRRLLYLNSVRIPSDLENYVAFEHVLGTLKRTGIGALRASALVGAKEWRTFLHQLQHFAGPGHDPKRILELQRALAKRDVRGLIVEEPLLGAVDFEGEVEQRRAAKLTYERSIAVSKELFNGTRMGRGANVKEIKQAVQGIVDQVLSNETSLGGLSALKDYDDYSFTHSVNVCIFCLAIGRRLGLTKPQLYDLGLAALVHDIGMSRIPAEILSNREALDEEGRAAMEAHTWLGALSIFGLRDFGEVPFRSMVVAYEHHMKVDQSGYPKPIHKRRISMFSKIVAVAADFDAATNTRSYTEARPADEVLRELWEKPELGHDPVIVKALINLLGIYPVGTVVILDSYELALVHAASTDATQIHRPVVRLLCDADGTWLEPSPLADLTDRRADGEFARSIIKVTKAKKYGIKVSDYLGRARGEPTPLPIAVAALRPPLAVVPLHPPEPTHMRASLRAAQGRLSPVPFVIALMFVPTLPASAQEAGSMYVGGPGSANFDLAARFAPYKIRDLVHSTTVSPRWIEGSEKFWYEWENADGTFYYIVDPVRGTKSQLFDNDRIAAELTRITLDPWDGQHLPITSIRFINDDTFQFDVESSQDEEVEAEDDDEEEDEQDQEEEEDGSERPQTKKRVHHFEYTVSTQTLRELENYEAPNDHPSWASVSPDGQTVVFAKHHNLWMMTGEEYASILDARRGESGDEADDAEDDVEVEEVQLTTDGEPYYSYAANSSGRGETNVSSEENMDDRKRAGISWSKDSQRFALVRRDQREVGDLWVVHVTGNKRPELETYKYDMPGEDSVTQSEILIYDLAARTMVKVDDDPWQDQLMSIINDQQFRYPDSDEARQSRWLSDDSDELWFRRISRDRKRTDVMVANTSTGTVRVVIEDRLNTYMETRTPIQLDSGDLLWWSERDGWAHIYRYTSEGTLVGRLTEGPWHVDGMVGVDEARGYLFVTGQGREEGEDPYYQHLYRVNLDGSGVTLLNPGNFEHRFSSGESRRFFVDSYSRVNTTPASALFNAQGQKILDLEEADFSALLAAGYQFPEPFKAEAADGTTDMYGVMYKPYDFDPNKKYPIVAYVYPGPQTESVSKFFSTNASEQALSQFGMIVVTLGNRGGNPDRSKWYHNYGYGDLRDYGLDDKKAVLEQLADRHNFIDLDRVGIYGHSGGGFMSTAAMLVYPDFFKVAVSSSGNHNNDVYNRNWSETHDGVKEVVDAEGNVSFEFDIEKNSDLAANLKGHLLLTTGDIDNNVHHAGTFRMAEALIKANKRFDFFVFPGQRHGYGDMRDYWFWLRAEYFVKHLLGDNEWDADIIPLQVDRPKTR